MMTLFLRCPHCHEVIGKPEIAASGASKAAPWHSVESALRPYRRMMRDLGLMAVSVERWVHDDSTAEQSRTLATLAISLRRIARQLDEVFRDPIQDQMSTQRKQR